MVKIILASQSPIRKEMLEEAKFPFEVIVSDADETPDETKTFEEQLKEISMRKAKVVFERTSNQGERIIVAADQNIVFNNKMYGKPATIEEARKLIKSMQGSDKVFAYTGNTVIHADGNKILGIINDCDISRMRMDDNIPEEELEDYLKNKSPLKRCAGISIIYSDFLHLEEGKYSTACGMTIENLQDMLTSI